MSKPPRLYIIGNNGLHVADGSVFFISSGKGNIRYSNFIRCLPDELVTDDVIHFDEKVFEDTDGGEFHNRSIEAKVIGEFHASTNELHYELKIIHSEGYEAIKPGTVIRRSISTLHYNPLLRTRWDDEWARLLGLDRE